MISLGACDKIWLDIDGYNDRIFIKEGAYETFGLIEMYKWGVKMGPPPEFLF